MGKGKDENYIKANMLLLVYETRHDTYLKKGVWRHERNNWDTQKQRYNETDSREREKHCQG